MADHGGDSGTSMISLIAHELSQPLAAARGSVLTLAARSDDPGFEIGDRTLLLDIVMRNLDQLQSLITSLRVFSEVENGERALETQSVAVSRLLQEIVDDYDEERTHRHLELICPESLVVDVDVTLFRQVLSNLVSNAVKFGPPGSTIQVIARAERRDTIISVHDAGPGVPRAQRDRIFDKAVRLDAGKRGFGLGLYIARAVVRAHGGRISVDKSPRGGAAFSVAIPRAA
ncbi:MAG: two-component system, OmpR family, sensor histidine kinase VicK [Actinomycetota bacterium]|jgi:signal transduction histidine kinase|nr:two-component system, OmpR family, sensor histidine kinase VicK [Actinomycetota bacterium]